MTLSQYMKQVAEEVEQCILSHLENEDKDIARTYEAMRYSVCAGGKRIRPFLVVSISDMLSGEHEKAVLFGAALEMIHTYSLIHDDLPCMDDDDLRRGRPTCHKVFGEAMAVLAGDGLLTEAFSLLSSSDLSFYDKAQSIAILSQAAGAKGMIGGQAMDMQAEADGIGSVEQLMKLCQKKTGALIVAAAKLGLLSAGITDVDIEGAILTYAANIGLAFQIVDDYLDVNATTEELGKPIGSDAQNGKTTFMTYMTEQEAKAEAEALTLSACQSISAIPHCEMLLQLANNLLHRTK
ncbi:MAG: polyprenyl synthetase family protein [Clostridia bacterium]|nr:polyprenyl synthetase family protein [Clostridia bacterium]